MSSLWKRRYATSIKNLNVGGWFLAGAVFPIIAFIVVLCAKRQPTGDEVWDEVARQRATATRP